MFKPKKIIPRATAVALALGGCHSGDLRGAAQDSCRKYSECNPSGFAENYTSLGDCADYVGYYIHYLSTGPDCLHALTDVLRCMAQTSCEEFNDEYSTACDPEETAAQAACDDYYGG